MTAATWPSATHFRVFNLEIPFSPNFAGGLLPVVAQDAESLEVLMLAWMNEEAWRLCLATGIAHYYSRSRQKLWRKGESSGHEQKISAIRLDCDSDAIVLLVRQKGGAACHTGHRTCFYRERANGETRICAPKIFDPDRVYGRE